MSRRFADVLALDRTLGNGVLSDEHGSVGRTTDGIGGD